MMQPATRATAGRAWLWAMLSLALLLGLPANASAASRMCRQLEAQLADSGRGGDGSPAQVRRYDRAIDAQEAQLQKARKQARRSNCGAFSFDRGNNSCAAISSQLDRMERNLRSLQGRRAELASGNGSPRRNRARILAALDANGCRDIPEIAEPREKFARRDNRSLFERLFGGPVRSHDDDEVPPIGERDRVRAVIGGYQNDYGGSYRTLCVRTCDGYYWPISYSSSHSNFQRDEQNCQTMCPGTEVRLFTHRVPEQESEQMVDLAGTPYADMPSAFKYREADFQRPQDCTCRAEPKNFSVITGNGSISSPAAAPDPVPLPQARPDPAADPETEANRNGGLNREAVKHLIDSSPSSLTAERKVRVVGPVYLPDPPKAEAPPVPGRTAIQ